MEKSIVLRPTEMSPEQRRAAEVLLGAAVAEDETVFVRAAKGQVIQSAPRGEARKEAFRLLLDRIDRTAQRAAHVPDAEIDAAIDEAVAYVRQHPR